MGKFGPNSENKGEYILPDYEKDEDKNSDIDESVADVDESLEESRIESIVRGTEDEIREPIISIPTGNISSGNSGYSQKFSWGGSNNQNSGSSIWGNTQPRQNISPFGSNPTTGSFWGNNNGGGFQAARGNKTSNDPINRHKQVIFCDFYDCLVETYGNPDHRPGLRPRDIYDTCPRFDVWERLRAFNPVKVYAFLYKNILPTSTNGSNDWVTTISYWSMCVSSYLRIPYKNFQVLVIPTIGLPKENTMLSVIDNPSSPIKRDDIVNIGIYSGVNGLSDIDVRASQICKVDYIDLINLLNNMY